MSSFLKKIDHIAIIMDGNGRWAKKNSLKKNSGHISGINTAINLCKSVARNKSTNHLTLYTFSTENWNRSAFEIKHLFNLIEETYELFKDTANQFNIKINHLGITNKLPRKTINTINSAVESTKNNTGLVLHIAFNYGGRREIVDAINSLKRTNIQISENVFKKYLYEPNIPDPDIIIRTGGDYRLSNFLLWQSAYSELFFIKTLWPDFKYSDLSKIINKFWLRKRNFGK
jgi:undecaprenyl diphosphate synthase